MTRPSNETPPFCHLECSECEASPQGKYLGLDPGVPNEKGAQECAPYIFQPIRDSHGTTLEEHSSSERSECVRSLRSLRMKVPLCHAERSEASR